MIFSSTFHGRNIGGYPWEQVDVSLRGNVEGILRFTKYSDSDAITRALKAEQAQTSTPHSLVRLEQANFRKDFDLEMFTNTIRRMANFARATAQNFSWQQTMLRIKDPKITVPFYENHFGFKLVHKIDFDQWKFSLYFLMIPREGEVLPEPGMHAISFG